MTVNSGWEPGETPWIRLQAGAANVPCPFCGVRRAIPSFGDESDDTGRVQLYCENEHCDARTVEIIVLNDGTGAHLRADVRALNAIDARPREARRGQMRARLLGDVLDDPDAPIVPHRISDQPLRLDVP